MRKGPVPPGVDPGKNEKAFVFAIEGFVIGILLEQIVEIERRLLRLRNKGKELPQIEAERRKKLPAVTVHGLVPDRLDFGRHGADTRTEGCGHGKSRVDAKDLVLLCKTVQAASKSVPDMRNVDRFLNKTTC